MIELTKPDKTLVLSAQRVLWLCRTLTNLSFKTLNLLQFMATAYENLVKHLKLVIRQLEQLTNKISHVDEDELLDLVDRINALSLILTDSES